ncbi:unnamed protein product [Lota lota]
MERMLPHVGILLRIILILYVVPQNAQADCIHYCNNTTTDFANGTCNTTTVPKAVTNLTVANVNTTAVHLTWLSPDDLQPYYIYRVQTTDMSGTTIVQQTESNSTVASVTGLQPGTGYYFNVTVVAPGCESTVEQAHSYTMPRAINNLTVANVNTTAVHLTWLSPDDLHPYYIYRVQTTDMSGTIVNQTQSNGTVVIVTGLQPGTGYFFNVTVVVAGRESAVEKAFNYTMPKAVTNLTVANVNTTAVHLTWLRQDDHKSDYTYQVTVFGKDVQPPKSTTTENYTVTSLTPGVMYTFQVSTVVQGVKSTEDNTTSYTTPRAVTNLTVANVNTTAVRLTWLSPDDLQPYYIYRVQTTDMSGTIVNQTQSNSTVVIVTGLQPGTGYFFNVTVVVQGRESAVEKAFTYTTPRAVTNLTVANVNTTAVRLTWLSPDDLHPYYIYRVQTTDMSGTIVNQTQSNSTVVIVTGLQAGTGYFFNVTVVVAGCESAVEQAFNYTMPKAVTNLTVANVNTTAVHLTWLRQDDHKSDYTYQVTVFGKDVQPPKSTTTENYTVTSLTPGVMYTFQVSTVVQGVKSTEENTTSYTTPRAVTNLTVANVNTTAVHLTWLSPDDLHPYYIYRVQTTDMSGTTIVQQTESNSTVASVTGLQPGTGYYFNVTVVVAGRESAVEQAFTYTTPRAVTNLTVANVNTTAVHLTWLSPDDLHPYYIYRVQTTDMSGTIVNQTQSNSTVVIVTGLQPGTGYYFNVTVVVAGRESAVEQAFTYTIPEQVHPTVSNQGLNDTILVSWAAPAGNVDHYYVYLNCSNQTFSKKLYPAELKSYQFDNLLPGREYSAMVITSSGPFNATSRMITTATFPNPPGPIEILTNSTSSIRIRWQDAHLKADSWLYEVTCVQSNQTKSDSTNGTTHTFSYLYSGTPYNISVATLGPLNLRSNSTTISVTTKPESVTLLTATTEEEAILLTWAKPGGYKPSYHYVVTWLSSGGPKYCNETKQEKLHVMSLVPGSPYNYTVMTVTLDGIQSDAIDLYECTKASSVPRLTYLSPNGSDAIITLFWTRPKGGISGFNLSHHLYQNDSGQTTSTFLPGPVSCSTNCTYTVHGLKYYTTYQLIMETQSCGTSSTPMSLICTTGITKPIIPQDYASFVQVTQKSFDMFTLEIKPQMLDSTTGPIRFYGVLVTDNISGMNSSDHKYLENTYEDWIAGRTSTYLATLKESLSPDQSGVKSRYIREVPNLLVAIGDGGSWKIYKNGALKANQQYRFAIVLFTQLNVRPDGIVDSLSSLVTTTEFTVIVNLPQNPVVIGIAVGASLGVFCVLFIIIIGFIIYWKKINKKECSDIQIHSIRNMSVHVEDYEAYYKKQKADSNCGFAEEFEDLKPVGTAQPRNSALALENKPKNRYNNVLPYDSSRVKLSIHGSPFDDYINASYMPGFNSKKEYIAAQGPLPGTVNEFWRMIWENNVQTLVMLTRCNEQGRVKCEKYWPEESKHFGYNTVTMTSEISLEDWTIRDFDIKNVKTAETRSVRHFHFTAWPDHGVPESTELLINFRHLVREHMDQYSANSPTVVHCSAGVGRTGTFIAIDRLVFQIERESLIDVYGIIHDLRMHRTLMVQTEDQYVFLNQCAMDIIRSRTGTNVDLIYQNTDAMCLYGNIEPRNILPNYYHNA